MDTTRIDLPVAATLRLQTRSGRLEVIAEPREDVLIEGDGFETRKHDEGATFDVRSGRAGAKHLSIRCPIGTDIVAGTQSGSVRMSGEFGVVSVTTASGHIELERADEADLRSAAGDVTLAACKIRCRLNSLSGRISAGEVMSAAAGTVSGSITMDRVAGAFKARSVSGSIHAHCTGDGTIAVKTVSGRVQIELPSGTTLQTRFKTLSGHVRNPFPAGSDCRVEAMSVSGSIDLVPA